MMGRVEDREEQVTITVQHDSLTNDSSPTQLIERQRDNLKFQHHLSAAAATGLILTYFIELGVQIYLTVSCCGQSVFKISMLLHFDWPAGAYLTVSLGFSSILVSILSMFWVWRGLDFAGRLCGRLLCYALHFLLLGLVWRYLKLIFAPDQADVQEFVGLRIFQAYIQSIPLTTVHLAWLLLAFPGAWSPNMSKLLWLVSIEALAIATGLIIASYVKSDQEETHQFAHEPSTIRILKCSNMKTDIIIGTEEKEQSLGRHLLPCSSSVLSIQLNLLSRALLLSARIISIAILLVYARYWTILLILLHLILSFLWVSLTEKKEYGVEMLLRGFQISYVLFWDLTCMPFGPLHLRTWAPPAVLVIAENSALLLLHWYIGGPQGGEMHLFVLVTVGTCLLLGTILLAGLHFVLNLAPFFNEFHCDSGIYKPEGIMKRIPECDKPYNEVILLPQLEQKLDLIKYGSSAASDNLPRNYSKMLTKDSSYSSCVDSTGRIRSSETSKRIYPYNDEEITSGNPISTPKRICKGGEVEKVFLRPAVIRSPNRSPPMNPAVTSTTPPSAPSKPHIDDTCCNDSNNGSWNSRNTNTLVEQDNYEVDNLTGTHFVFCYPTKAWTHQNQQDDPDKVRRKVLLPYQNLSLSREARTSSPVQIKSASRVVMNRPKRSRESPSRCPCVRPQWRKQEILEDSPDFRRQPTGPCNDRLLEDAYGILICETQPSSVPRGSSSALGSIFHVNKKLRVICAKCFQNHDPLLTDCPDDSDWVEMPAPMPLPSETTTDYPSSGTEISRDSDRPSSVLSSHATAWPNHSHHQAHWSKENQIPSRRLDGQGSMMPRVTQREFPKEFTSREYVQTWLLTNSLTRSRQQRHSDLFSFAQDKIISGKVRVPKRSTNTQTQRGTHRINPNEPRRRYRRRELADIGDSFYVVAEPTTVKVNIFEDSFSNDDEALSPVPNQQNLGLNLIENMRIPFPNANSRGSVACPSPQEALYENEDGFQRDTFHLFFKDLETIV